MGIPSELPNRFRLGPWRVLLDQNRLERADETAPAVKLEPKVMAVLRVLAMRAGETVSRDELLESVWQGRPGRGHRHVECRGREYDLLISDIRRPEPENDTSGLELPRAVVPDRNRLPPLIYYLQRVGSPRTPDGYPVTSRPSPDIEPLNHPTLTASNAPGQDAVR